MNILIVIRPRNSPRDNKKHIKISLYIMSMSHFLLLLLVTLLVEAEEQGVSRKKRQAEEQNPIVETQYGRVMGYAFQDANNNSACAFRGIPYAKPPVGKLRFKDPQPPDPWGEEILDALSDGNICPQPSGNSLTDIVGDENCLFLNVYTPRLPLFPGALLPVMFWIHGGGFSGGSGSYNASRPEHLIAEGVIVVTMNYRLGPLGFLCLRKSAPGNAGMKDQVAALRWVQGNIAAFGGDPAKVTIFGESAGAASVHFLLLSPMSKGLFRAAISMSGNAIDGWAFNKRIYEVSENLAAGVGCPVNDISTLQCMQNVSFQALLQKAYTSAITELVTQRVLAIPFSIAVDFPQKEGERFLPHPPTKMISEGNYHHVPYLLGFSNNESSVFYATVDFLNKTNQQSIYNYTDAIVLPELRLCGNDTSKSEALQEILKFYMNCTSLNNQTIVNYLTMLTDIFFGEGVYYTLRQMAKYHYAPLYQYSFSVNDVLNYNLDVSERPFEGAAHSEILGYLFGRPYTPDVPVNSTAYISRKRLVRMWTNFAKYCNPTPFRDPLLNVRWKQYRKSSRNYLDIGTELTRGKDLNKSRALFWERFYKHFKCRMNY